ncbi:hypothetical protein ACP70R_034978 [Stipagrostis hirtigluma subsp. patula]
MAAVLKEFPDKMLVTAAQCVFSAVQSFVVAAVAERDFSKWKLHFDISLFAIFYSGFVVIGAAYYLQAWCVEKKDPVFLAIWIPLVFVFTMFCSSFFLGEVVHLGSVTMDASTKPYAAAIVVQLIFTGMLIVSKAAFDHGMNSYVFVFYRQAAGSILLLPLALLLHRKNVRSMPYGVLLKLFFCALIGNTLSLNMYHVGLKFTSATVVSAIDNSAPAVTFFLALLSRMEVVKLKSLSGIAKLTGIALCLAGVLVIALYAGPSLSPVNHHRAFPSHASGSKANVTRGAWAAVLKEYPNKMLITAVQCLFGTMQSFVVAAVAERDFSRWKLRLDIRLLAIFYSGILVIGAVYYLQAWCMEMKGPVFLVIWTPLCFVLTIFCSSFFLGEIVHLGSILGGILLVGSFYSVLWGKSKESERSDDCTPNEKDQQKKSAEDDDEEQETMDTKELTSTRQSPLQVDHV